MSITEEFEKVLVESSKELVVEYTDEINNIEMEKAKFRNGKSIKYLLKPNFYNQRDWNGYSEFCSALMTIGNKVIDAYAKDERIRAFYNFDEVMSDILAKSSLNNVYPPCVRIDIFFREGKIKLCEINADSAGGMRKDMLVNEALLKTGLFGRLSKKYKLTYKNLINAQVLKYIDIYRSNLLPQKPKISPVVGIINFRDTNDFQENVMYGEEYMRHGVEAVLADPRDLVYFNEKLYFNGKEIDFVQKEVIDEKLYQHKTECSGFIAAMTKGDICYIGSTKGSILDDKMYFALLYSELAEELLTKEEIEFVKEYIPFTCRFKGSADLYAQVLNNKDNYVIKSKDSYGGVGVFAGKEKSAEEWVEIVDSAWNKNYVVQDFVETDTNIYPYIKDGNLATGRFKITVGLFCYSGELSGMYSRASKELLIKDYGENDYYLGNIFYEER